MTEARQEVEKPRISLLDDQVRSPKGHYRSSTEQEVLRVLWASPKRLVRGEILKSLPQDSQRSGGRVGQILTALYKDGLLDREIGKTQGSSAASFYALTDKGRQVCQGLGFEQLLRFAVAQADLAATLTARRLAAAAERSGQIVAVWGISGGLGRSTLVAHLAKGLWEKRGTEQPLLVVDLDFGGPDLDSFFAPEGLPECVGLAGLLMDFQRKEPQKRAFFLLRALGDPRYVVTVEDCPQLVYLPSGLSPSHRALSPSERAEALALLRQEAEKSNQRQGGSARDEAEPSFFAALREAMAARFERTVIDSQQGLSLGAWIATQELADELVLCLNETSTSAATIDGVRAILARYLKHSVGDSKGGAVKFLFRLTAPTALKDLDGWVDEHLVLKRQGVVPMMSYGSEQIVYNARLAENPYDWQYTPFYKHLIAKLQPGSRSGFEEISPPEMQALKVLLSSTNPNKRSIAAGVLENMAIEELARCIRWATAEKSLPQETDAEGVRLLRSVLEAHAVSLFKLVLGSGVSWTPEEEKEVWHAAPSA